MIVTDEMVNRFLSWPLPESVCADLIATRPGAPHRSGTSLLSAIEAKQMLEHVLAYAPVPDRFGLIELLWSQGQVKLDTDDNGYFRIDFEGAECQDRIWLGMDPKDVTDMAIKSVEDGATKEPKA